MIHKLEADSILFNTADKMILSNIYIKCETGKITGLLGRNSQGKSCLFNIIFGTSKSISKSIRFDNISFNTAFSEKELLVFLPQFNFIPEFLTLKKIFFHFNLSYSELIIEFPEFSTNYKSQFNALSGGQKRLIEVYVIIKTKSKFAILDEPFSHLMPLHIEKMCKILWKEKKNKGFLISDHMYSQIVDLSDYLYMLSDGQTFQVKNRADLAKFKYINNI